MALEKWRAWYASRSWLGALLHLESDALRQREEVEAACALWDQGWQEAVRSRLAGVSRFRRFGRGSRPGGNQDRQHDAAEQAGGQQRPEKGRPRVVVQPVRQVHAEDGAERRHREEGRDQQVKPVRGHGHLVGTPGLLLGLGGVADPTYIQVIADRDETFLNMTNRDGKKQSLKPGTRNGPPSYFPSR